MHGCGKGRRDSSLRIVVNSWRLLRIFSAASGSLERFEAPRHACYGLDEKLADQGEDSAYQKMVVFSLEACQTLFRVIGRGFIGSRG